jgi:hypothetical protein
MGQLMEKLGRLVLQKQKKNLQRDKQVYNFKSARSAVILFDALIPDSFREIKEFSKYIREQNIQCKVYGYLHQKEVPHEMLLWSNFEFLTKNNLNWLGKPRGEIAENYFKSEPDILFVFAFEEMLALDYLTELSRARFKVGCYTEEPNDYDLMINPAKGQCDIHFFIEQVKHYINMLNPS